MQSSALLSDGARCRGFSRVASFRPLGAIRLLQRCAGAGPAARGIPAAPFAVVHPRKVFTYFRVSVSAGGFVLSALSSEDAQAGYSDVVLGKDQSIP